MALDMAENERPPLMPLRTIQQSASMAGPRPRMRASKPVMLSPGYSAHFAGAGSRTNDLQSIVGRRSHVRHIQGVCHPHHQVQRGWRMRTWFLQQLAPAGTACLAEVRRVLGSLIAGVKSNRL